MAELVPVAPSEDPVLALERVLPQIVAAAARPAEMLRGLSRSGLGSPDIDVTLQAWDRAVSPEGASWLSRRLAWDGWSVEAARDALASAATTQSFPSWGGQLALFAREATAQRPGPTGVAGPRPGVGPFDRLLGPAIVVARHQLLEHDSAAPADAVHAGADVMDVTAHNDLETFLLRRLTMIAGPVLQTELTKDTSPGPPLVRALGFPATSAPLAGIEAFTDRHLRDGWHSLVVRYPVMGRLLAEETSRWVETTSELIVRLREDIELLAPFGVDRCVRVAAIEAAAGDPHNGGRRVAILTWGNGSKIVYKPRSVQADLRFNDLLRWCNTDGRALPLRVSHVLDRGRYGWIEYIGHQSCSDAQSAERYFFRAGMLMCLLRLLQATDCHNENIVAHGEHPVLIDHETLMHGDPRPMRAERTEVQESWASPLTDTVLRSGMLPRWQPGGPGDVDLSGLGGTQPVHGTARHNLVLVGGTPVAPSDHVESVCAGFATMYALVSDHRAELMGPSSPLAKFAQAESRFIHRATDIYSRIIGSALEADALGSGRLFGARLEQLARAYLTAASPPRSWPLFDAEVAACARLDIPIFHNNPATADLIVAGRRIVTGAFHRPPVDAVLARLGRLNAQDLQCQLSLIRLSLRVHSAPIGLLRRHQTREEYRATAPVSAEGFLSEAIRVGDALADVALTDGREGLGWIGLRYPLGARGPRLEVLDTSLYDGTAGPALFFAALFRSTSKDRFRECSLRAIHPLQSISEEVDPDARRLLARMRGLGAGSGLGAYIYSLTRTGTLLGGAEGRDLVDVATRLADWFTPQLLRDHHRHDVLGGLAGVVLSLLALYDATSSGTALQAAARCAERLVECQAQSKYGAASSADEGGLTGFAHGAAGVAYALHRLDDKTRQPRYRPTVAETLAFERSQFSPKQANWPDLRDEESRDAGGYPVKWCHGATGIAIARLGCLASGSLAGAEEEARVGLATTQRALPTDLDSVCCGNWGRVDALLEGSRVLGDNAYRRAALRHGANLINLRRGSGSRLPLAGREDPGFFQGMSGIGYTLLRLVDPTLPCFLRFE